ncbi:MAG: hypothetical protein ACOCRX_03655 [Candidatus Woesearchaeota archaeon]
MNDNNWIKAQRIGLISTLIRSWPNESREDIIIKNKLNYLLLKEVENMQLETFPPWVLSELSRLKDHQIIDELKALLEAEQNPDLAKKYILNKDMTDTQENSIVKSAQTWAITLLKGYTEPRRLLDYGQQLFPDDSWYDIEKNPKKLDDFADKVEKLRMININIFNENQDNSRFGSIYKIIKLLNNKIYAHQIANILYHNQFCWPLLVLGEPELSISLPLAIEISYDGKNMIRTKPSNGEIEKGFDFSQWIENDNLKEAREAGYILWRSKHGHYGGRNNSYSYRKMAKNMSVIFDFRIAKIIGNEIFENIEKDCIPIKGNSADSCLAQAVLDKLLGRYSLGYTAITGEIGKFQNHDFGFNEISYPKEKLKYVNDTNFFSNAIIPLANFENISISNKEINNINILSVDKQSQIADVVQSRPWRRHQYIRCPELKWYIHDFLLRKKREVLQNDDMTSLERLQGIVGKNIEDTIKIVENNEEPVCFLEDTYPIQVMSALWYINNKTRTGKFDFNRGGLTPPKISWAVIRAIESEKDDQFWQVFWEIIGGNRPKVFEDFILSHNKKYAIEKLEKALKTFNPGINNPDFRSPDLFIIIGSEHFENSYEECKNNTHVYDRSFMVSPILEALSGSDNLQYRGPYKELNDLIGKTRIILLSDQKNSIFLKGRDPGFLELHDEKEVEFLKSLCVYRWGFNYRMAKLLVFYPHNKLENIDVHKTLKHLTKKGFIRKVNMWYYIPENIRRYLLEKLDLNNSLEYHYFAASSFAPYLFEKSQKTLSMPIEKVLNAKYLREAKYHLEEIKEKALKRKNHFIYHNEAIEAYNKLVKFTGLPSKSSLDNLLRMDLNNSAYLLASYIVNSNKLKKPHPLILLSLAEAYSNKLKFINNKQKKNELRNKTNELYEKAIEKSMNNVLNEKTQRYTEFKAISEYLLFLKYQYFRNKQKIKQLLIKAEKLFDNIKIDENLKFRGINYKIFELIGANKLDHEEASSFYLKVLNYDIPWIQVGVKGLGAASYIDSVNKIDKIKDKIDKLFNGDNIINDLQKPIMIKNIILDLTHEKDHVNERWYEGLKKLYEFKYLSNYKKDKVKINSHAKTIINEIIFYILLEEYKFKYSNEAKKHIKNALDVNNMLSINNQMRSIDEKRIRYILNNEESINRNFFEFDEINEFSIKSPALFLLISNMHSEGFLKDKDLDLLIEKYINVLRFITDVNPNTILFQELQGNRVVDKKIFQKIFCPLLENAMTESAREALKLINNEKPNNFSEKILLIEIKIGIEIINLNWRNALKIIEKTIEFVDFQKSELLWLELKILKMICKTILEEKTYVNELKEILSETDLDENYNINESFSVRPILEGLKKKNLNNKNLNEIANFLKTLDN